MTSRIRYEVRDAHGQILDPYRLECELPLFIKAPLAEIGPKYPFYDELGVEWWSQQLTARLVLGYSCS